MSVESDEFVIGHKLPTDLWTDMKIQFYRL